MAPAMTLISEQGYITAALLCAVCQQRGEETMRPAYVVIAGFSLCLDHSHIRSLEEFQGAVEATVPSSYAQEDADGS